MNHNMHFQLYQLAKKKELWCVLALVIMVVLIYIGPLASGSGG